jgi:glycosyltransferase involved in cell wall biosynthesis
MRVSVLLACWNAETYVGDAVRSVLDQRPAPFELIAVDDGSTDGSAAVLEGFGDRLTLVRQENRGVGAALNRAAAEATGEALAFIDADDVWTPGKLARQAEALKAEPELDAVFGFTETFLRRASQN